MPTFSTTETPGGYQCGEVASALQKDIRRGNEEQALFWASELDARDIALQFGHQDGGELVRKLYGHPDAAIARDRIRRAFEQAPPAPLPLVATSTR